MSPKKRLVVLDMHAILHRAYHALPDFSSSKGEPTGALYGLISILVRAITDLGPDYIVAAYDLPGPTHRHLAFEEYKATRVKTDDALVAQIVRSRDVLDAFGIPRYEAEGFEADDVIGTIVEETKGEKNLEVIVASGDLDMMQLLDGLRVRVFRMRKGLADLILYDEDSFQTEFGFSSEHLTDFKGLRGDPSDNIPGIKGVGEKTASALIVSFGSIENLYKVLKKNPEKVEAAGIKEAMLKKLLEGEEDAKFSKVLAEIRRDAPIKFSVPKKEWKEGVAVDRALDMLAEFEFRSLVPRVRALLGAAPAPEQEEEAKPQEQVPEEDLHKALLAVWVLDSTIAEPELEDIYRLGKSRTFADAFKNIRAEIKKRELTFVYEKIELPLMPVLRQMERCGILVDRKFLATLATQYHAQLGTIAAQIYKAAGGEFNINSPKQLGDVLFDKLGLVAKKKTAGGARSTRESELQKMKDMHPIISDILAHRELQKLLSNYIDIIPTLLDGRDRLHTSFVQTGSTTGRLASQNPNLQNIPIKTELGRAIRHAFVAEKGMMLVSFDYSQIELRIAALLSGDEGLADIFKSGRDVHREVAMRVFKVKSEEVTYEQRRRAKVINFGILYGMGVNSLREALGTDRAEAQEFYNQYFEAFPRLAAYLDETKQDAARQGYTETFFGRRRYFEGIQSTIPFVRASAERMAINAPIQGTQADIVKLAMVEIAEMLRKEKLEDDVRMLLQVHDELVFEISEKKISELAPRIKNIMEQVLTKEERQGIPFNAEGKNGGNWGEMEELKI